jgi:S1-C subfamily serine protease
VKEYLSRQSIAYRERDVSQDPAAAQEMVRISGQQGVPVTVIDNGARQVVVGFDRQQLDRLLAETRRPRLGAAVADAAEMAAKGRTTLREGAYVGKVRPGTPAARAGLEAGDVIVELAGRSVSSSVGLEQLLAGAQPGARLPLTVVRDGERRTMTLTFDRS